MTHQQGIAANIQEQRSCGCEPGRMYEGDLGESLGLWLQTKQLNTAFVVDYPPDWLTILSFSFYDAALLFYQMSHKAPDEYEQPSSTSSFAQITLARKFKKRLCRGSSSGATGET
jgi:hypothetical protein